MKFCKGCDKGAIYYRNASIQINHTQNVRLKIKPNREENAQRCNNGNNGKWESDK
jgi:hypothetical protein